MSVRVEKAGNRILILSAQPLYGMKETIPGANFRQDKVWTAPLNLENCALLRDRFGKRLQIGPALREWAVAEKAQREALQATASASDAKLRVVPALAPVLAVGMASRTYQRAAVRFVADAIGRDGCRRALIADTVGLGKTAEALASVIESQATGPFLVVAPKTAVNTAWTPEIRRWLPDAEIVTVPEGRAARDNILNSLLGRADNWATDGFREENPSLARTWVVIHPWSIRTKSFWECPLCQVRTKFKSGVLSALDCGHSAKGRKLSDEHEFPQLFGMPWGAVVFDESDQTLIKKTATPTLARRGADLLRDLVRPGGVRIAMSGTPFRSKPHQIWSTLNWLDPLRFSAKWPWIERYWELGGYSGYEIGKFKGDREQMLADELSDIMIRRTRQQVRADLPAKLYAGSHLDPTDETSPKGVWLEMDPKQARAYAAMERKAAAEIEGGEVSAVGVLAEMTRLRQFGSTYGRMSADGEFHPELPSNKYDWLLEFLQANGFPEDPSTKVVVVSQFTQTLNLFRDGLAREFKKEIGMITGEVSQSRRDSAVERFEDPKSRLNLIFLNTKAGGSAITLDQADVMVFLDETHVDDDQEQAEGRIDNRNPERKISPRTYYYLRSLGTIEQGIAVKNAAAKREGRRILDGGRSAAAIGREVLVG